MATEVVNSYNIYVDTERNITATSKGDDIMLALSQTPITCADNQYIRLTLQSFSMYKSFTNVNPNNNLFRINGDFGAGGAPAPTQTDFAVFLEPKNYQSPQLLGGEFATQLSGALAVLSGVTLGPTPITLPQDITTAGNNPTDNGNNDNIISFVINFTAPHQISNLAVQFRIEDGDIFELLGGDRIYPTDPNTKTSIFITEAPDFGAGPQNDKILVRCKYNCQLSTQQNVYLRTDINNTNIQTESFNSGNTDNRLATNLSSSRILAKLVIDNEFVNYTTGTQMEYFVNLTTKQITFLRLFLTDSHGRTIPENVRREYPPRTGPTAYLPLAGGNGLPNPTPVNQSTLGNRSFECIVKVDILQYMGGQNNVLKAPPPPKTVPARFGTEPLNKFDYGESGYPDKNFAMMRMN
tara:strand:- start:2179 stop:3405 length:1227 start_codon:yes stop_codon:yes gene_type:complete